jgi:hypothetical protein
MKLPSARSAERSSSSRTSRRRLSRNRHNLLPMKKSNQPVAVVVGPKVPLVGLKVLPADQVGLLVGLRDLPVDQADHLEGAAEDDGPRKG